MIDLESVEALVRRLESEQVTLFECEDSHGRLRLLLDPSAQEEVSAQFREGVRKSSNVIAVSEAAAVLRSPGIGILQLQHPFVGGAWQAEGGRAANGQIVAFLKAGELLVPVEADRDGVIARFVVKNGELVGYGVPILEWA